MKTFLDVVAAWTALDLVLIAAWHLAHIRSRRSGVLAVASGSRNQRVYSMAPQARPRETRPSPVHAGRG